MFISSFFLKLTGGRPPEGQGTSQGLLITSLSHFLMKITYNVCRHMGKESVPLLEHCLTLKDGNDPDFGQLQLAAILVAESLPARIRFTSAMPAFLKRAGNAANCIL